MDTGQIFAVAGILTAILFATIAIVFQLRAQSAQSREQNSTVLATFESLRAEIREQGARIDAQSARIDATAERLHSEIREQSARIDEQSARIDATAESIRAEIREQNGRISEVERQQAELAGYNRAMSEMFSVQSHTH